MKSDKPPIDNEPTAPLPCPICGADPLVFRESKTTVLVVCDNQHPEFKSTSSHSRQIAVLFWNEDVLAFKQEGFAA